MTTTLPGRVALAERTLDVRRTQLLTQRLAAATESDPPGTIRGTACAYGMEVDRGYGLALQLEAGCFADQVPYASRVKVLWQHQDESPIGGLTDLTDGPKKLDYVGRILDNPAVPDAVKALALLREKTIDEVSVGFRILKYAREVDEENDRVLYRILKAHLMELSVVTFGAMGQDATVEEVLAADGGPDLAAMEARARANQLRARLLRARLRGVAPAHPCR